ncbi:MAG: hypothetical protein HRU20_12955 [Pseudomonadales bacterium]|nr:hypothetical protein [Pseudomonadales bacterium]
MPVSKFFISLPLYSVLCILALYTPCLKSEILWSTINLSYLKSNDYLQVFPPAAGQTTSGQIISLEHIGLYNWGKSYFFLDRFHSDNEQIISHETYIEFSADLSLSWMTGSTMSYGPMKDSYIVTTWENANPLNSDNLLVGLGARWNIPGFIFVDTNLYYRFQDDLGIGMEDNYQLTVAWALPFTFANVKFAFDGFFDWRTSHKNDFSHVASDFHSQPQIKIDMGHFWQQDNQYYLGFEWDYWKNKYGVQAEDQSALQVLLQVHF